MRLLNSKRHSNNLAVLELNTRKNVLTFNNLYEILHVVMINETPKQTGIAFPRR